MLSLRPCHCAHLCFLSFPFLSSSSSPGLARQLYRGSFLLFVIRSLQVRGRKSNLAPGGGGLRVFNQLRIVSPPPPASARCPFLPASELCATAPGAISVGNPPEARAARVTSRLFHRVKLAGVQHTTALPIKPSPSFHSRRHTIRSSLIMDDGPLELRLPDAPSTDFMTQDEWASNISLAINYLVSLLKKNWQNIRSLHIKSTMGPPQTLY